MEIEHILFATDLSAESMQPAKAVADLARRQAARITLLHVVEELLVPPHGILAPVTHASSGARESDARKALVEARSAFGSGVDVAVDVVASDKVAVAVAEYAREQEVDLVCVSTHGRTGFRHLALGSVAESILRHSKVPVLVFPLT